MAIITLAPYSNTAYVDGKAAAGVDFTGIDPDIYFLQWYGTQGYIEPVWDPADGAKPPNTPITSLTPYQGYVDQAEAIIYAQENPVTYYNLVATAESDLGRAFIVTAVGWPQPPNTTTLVPPIPALGQTLQWDGSDWVLASFDITLGLAQAKTSLIQTVNQDGAAAVNTEVSMYSTVQQIEAPAVTDLETVTYPGTTIGEYQTYIDGVVSSATATINAATSTEDLYSFNPASLPYLPSSSGIISTGRGAAGALDMNISYFVDWNSTTVLESDTELYAPATGTVMPYGSGGPGQFDSMGAVFTLGNYTIQVRQASTGFVLAEYECPLAVANVDVEF